MSDGDLKTGNFKSGQNCGSLQECVWFVVKLLKFARNIEIPDSYIYTMYSKKNLH